MIIILRGEIKGESSGNRAFCFFQNSIRLTLIGWYPAGLIYYQKGAPCTATPRQWVALYTYHPEFCEPEATSFRRFILNALGEAGEGKVLLLHCWTVLTNIYDPHDYRDFYFSLFLYFLFKKNVFSKLGDGSSGTKTGSHYSSFVCIENFFSLSSPRLM